MSIIGTIAGICFGYAILFFFMGVRRHENKQLNLAFSIFAFSYAGTLLLGILFRSQTTAEAFLALTRWDGIFLALAFISLNWYVSMYTAVKPKLYLWIITAVIIIANTGAMLTPTVSFSTMPLITTISLPWGEEVNALAGPENIWGTLILLYSLATLLFIILAGLVQWRRGERQEALVLLAGMSWFIIALTYEILAEVDLWVYYPLAETGFLGIAIALSLQMANQEIRAEETLAASEKELEALVAERTNELGQAQTQLIAQAKETAVAAERSRLARELHDVVTQILFSINLIGMSLPRLWKRDPLMAESSTNELQRLTRGALAEMRILLRQLRPQTIVASDMSTLLIQLSESVSARHDIPGDVQVDRLCKLPPEAHLALYRIAQEAMNNITKHAEASRLALNLSCDAKTATLSIEDNGHGFDHRQVSGKHMGLNIMQERAESIGADLKIESRPQAGTTITVIWSNSRRRERVNE